MNAFKKSSDGQRPTGGNSERLAPPPPVAIEPHSEGVVLPVRAQPGARRNEIRGEQDGALKVCVTQAPEKGKANKAMIDVLCKCLALRKSQLELIAGETSHQKRFLIRGVSEQELTQRIQQAIAGRTR